MHRSCGITPVFASRTPNWLWGQKMRRARKLFDWQRERAPKVVIRPLRRTVKLDLTKGAGGNPPFSQYHIGSLHRCGYNEGSDGIDRVASVTREWRVLFEALEVPASECEKVASAFRRPSEIGLEHIEAALPK